MSITPFCCRFTIQRVNTIATGIYSIGGFLTDESTNEWGPSNVIVGNVVYDESTIDATVNRWEVTSIISRGTPNANSLTVQVIYDDDDTEPRIPIVGSGVICEVTDILRLSQLSSDFTGISETLRDAIKADDNRRIDNINSSAGGTYTNSDLTPYTVGGIPAGSSFNNVTMQDMWTQLLYPYQSPAFSSFYLNGYSTLEIGGTIPANINFVFSTTNSANIQTDSIGITDTTLSTQLASGLNYNSSPVAVVIAPITNNAIATHTFGISGYNTHSQLFSASYSVNWYWRTYYGASMSATLTPTDILNLQHSQLANTIAGTYSIPEAGYKYICICNDVNTHINSIMYGAFNMPLANTTPYTLVDAGGFTYDLQYSVIHGGNYRVYRSQNILNSPTTLVVG